MRSTMATEIAARRPLLQWYTIVMVTVHPRIQVTPDDELLAALNRAAERWPGASRSELVRRLALVGDRFGTEEATRRMLDRQLAMQRLRTLGAEIYDPRERELLRQDWER